MDDTRKHFHAEDTLFTGVRYVASDDIWLSPQNGRENAVISFIVLGDQSRTGNHTEFDLYAQGLERICSEKYQGASMDGEGVFGLLPPHLTLTDFHPPPLSHFTSPRALGQNELGQRKLPVHRLSPL
jgi:hypothetical protein